jgi:hypothetical protein
MVKLLLNTKWNNATNAACWLRLTNLVICGVKAARNLCGFAAVVDENQDQSSRRIDVLEGSRSIC